MKKDFSYITTNSKILRGFTKIPNKLLFDDEFSTLSVRARFLIGPMISRLGLSQENNFKDENGAVFIIFSHKDACSLLNCSRSTSNKVFDELEENGIIKRKRQGLGKPDMIFLASKLIDNTQAEVLPKTKNSDSVTRNSDVQKKDIRMSENNTSGCTDLTQPDVSDSDTNNNNINNIKINKNKKNYHFSSFNPTDWEEKRNDYIEIIKANTDYDILIKSRQQEKIDEIINVMADTLCTSWQSVRISGQEIPLSRVKEKFLSMNQFHIEYICDSFSKNKTDVKNMHSYLLTSIYRAPDVINHHYASMANHDLKACSCP